MVSCEKETQNNIPMKYIVVEGYPSPGDSANIEISKILMYASNDSVVQTIDTLHVKFTVNHNTFLLSSIGNGKYFLQNNTFKIKDGDSVSIAFTCSGQTITAGTTIPSKPQNFKASDTSISIPAVTGGYGYRQQGNTITPILLTWNNPDNSYYLVAIQTAEANPVPINARDTVGTNARFRISRTQPYASSGISIGAGQFIYFGKQRIILYHLNADYAALYNFSGNTTLDISEPHTNIINGFGIFSGINADTLYIDVLQQ